MFDLKLYIGLNKNVGLSVSCIDKDGCAVKCDYRCRVGSDGVFIEGKGDLEDSIRLEPISEGYICHRKIKNTKGEKIRLKEISVLLSGIVFADKTQDDYFYCGENIRLYGNSTIPVDFDRYNEDSLQNARFGLTVDRTYVDPGVKEGRICSSPYQPFPAILLSNYNTSSGIVVGSLSQDVFYHNFDVFHSEKGLNLSVFSSFKDIGYREIATGEELVDCFYIGATEKADDINSLFDGYNVVLREVLKDNQGSKDTNRHTLIWDSWNDGIYRDVSEDMLLNEAKALKKYFPTVEWFQVDDGYSAYCEENVDLDAHGIGVVYEGEEGIDRKKFPDGLKSYTDKVKALGLKPAIWIGAFCPIKTKIYRERPEWFIDYNFRVDFTQPLDVSKKEVRDYMQKAIKTFVCDYGFEGIKHDFWSYAFEDRADLLQNKDKSGYEYRSWWLSFMRETLGEGGYIGVGCDLSQGNPFIGKYVNQYRFGLDVGAGTWNRVITTMRWGVSALSAHSGDLYIPNSDSIGMLPGLSDRDFMFVVNYQIITRSLVEISGRFSKVYENDPRLKVLQRAVKYLNNGENVYFAKYDYRKKGVAIPEIIYIKSAFDSESQDYVTVALFNAEEENKEVSFTPKDVGLSYGKHQTEFVWEDKKEDLKDFVFTLLPHESLLLKIKK